MYKPLTKALLVKASMPLSLISLQLVITMMIRPECTINQPAMTISGTSIPYRLYKPVLFTAIVSSEGNTDRIWISRLH